MIAAQILFELIDHYLFAMRNSLVKWMDWHVIACNRCAREKPMGAFGENHAA